MLSVFNSNPPLRARSVDVKKMKRCLLIPVRCCTSAKGAKRPFGPRLEIVVCSAHSEPHRVRRFSRYVNQTEGDLET
jgi:hypothetical protein